MASSSLPTTKVGMGNQTEPNWLELPKDITQNILKRLGTVEIITSACQVCPLWWNICKDPHMWRTIRISKFCNPRRYNDAYLKKICRNAVERSCGQLEDIDIESFATDDLLQFIANCAINLSRIRLYKCKEITDKGFSEAVKKLPFLVELDLSETSQLSKDAFEAVGNCCPLLKSLKYGMILSLKFRRELSLMYGRIIPYGGKMKSNDVIFVISETMPGLCHLKISGNVLTKEGLLAILNGCPFLESLDLRECYLLYLELNESLKKRCYDQIKDFRLPLQLQAYDDDDDSKSDCDRDDINWGILSENSYGSNDEYDLNWGSSYYNSSGCYFEDDSYDDIF